MVKKKYPAIYTDDLGCDKANVYFCGDKLYLEVRDCIFVSDNYDFDFYLKNDKNAKKLFYLKDNVLVEYVLDTQIPLIIKKDNKNIVEKCILRLERKKNYYNNSLLLNDKKSLYEVQGSNFKQLIVNMKRKLLNESKFKIDNLYLISAEY